MAKRTRNTASPAAMQHAGINIARKYFSIVSRVVNGDKQLASFEWSSQSKDIDVLMFQMWTEFHRQVRPAVDPSDETIKHVVTLFSINALTEPVAKWQDAQALTSVAKVYSTEFPAQYTDNFQHLGFYYPMKAKPRNGTSLKA